MKLFNGKYDVKIEPNQYILNEHGLSKTGKPAVTSRYFTTFEQLVWRLLELEQKTLLNEKEWRSMEALAKAITKSNDKVLKEVKKIC